MESVAQAVARRNAEEMYRSGQFLCSEAVFLVANEFLGRPVSEEMVRLASGFPVGMGMAGCACGALTGGVMALGLKYGRTTAGAPTPGMFETARELHTRFKARRKCVCCRALIRKFTFGSPEHLAQCVAITGEVASDVIDLLDPNPEERTEQGSSDPTGTDTARSAGTQSSERKGACPCST